MDRILSALDRVNRAPSWIKASLLFAALAVCALVFPHTPDALVGFSVLGVGMAGTIMDSTVEFCDAVALNTGGAGTYLIGNVVDLGVVRDIGNGRPVYLVISVDTAVTSGGAATVQFVLASDGQAALAADATETRHWTSAAIPKATLVAGYMLIIALPPESPAYERYLGIEQITAVAALTAGKINAYLTVDPPKSKAYPNDPNIV